MKGQLSAEMLILIAVVLAIVAIVATNLLTTAEKSSEKITQQTDLVLSKADEHSKAEVGEFCIEDENCISGNCLDNTCQ